MEFNIGDRVLVKSQDEPGTIEQIDGERMDWNLAFILVVFDDTTGVWRDPEDLEAL